MAENKTAVNESPIRPINNIWWVPTEKISFLPTLDGFAQGGQNSWALVEADSAGEARINLRKLLSFADNYNDLPPEKRKNLKPFKD